MELTATAELLVLKSWAEVADSLLELFSDGEDVCPANGNEGSDWGRILREASVRLSRLGPVFTRLEGQWLGRIESRPEYPYPVFDRRIVLAILTCYIFRRVMTIRLAPDR